MAPRNWGQFYMFERAKNYLNRSWLGNNKSFMLRFPDASKSNWPFSGFQLDLKPGQAQQFGPIYACVNIIAQEIAKLPIYHYRDLSTGGREIVTNSAASRVLRKPNRYQTRSDFFLYFVSNLLYGGNGYAVAERNNRREISALYPRSFKSIAPFINPDNGDIYYNNSCNPYNLTPDLAELLPARDVLNVRLYTPNNPLIGETPIVAGCYSAATGLAIERNGAAFFNNQSRPSGFLRVPGKLGKDARERIKTGWQESYSKENQGKVGVLSDGAEWQQITVSAADADLVLQHKMTVEDIARIFRVPMFMLGDLENSSFNNVESSMRFFYQSTLSFYLEHIEAALDDLFKLPPGEKIQFDFESNLRTNFAERIKGLSDGVTGGIYKIDEARNKENLPKIEGGENVFIQNQMQTVKDRANNIPLQAAEESTPPVEEATAEEVEAAANLIQKAINNELYH